MNSVAIIGGGPAGMATAISLVQTDPSLQVVVVERSEYEQLRIGETLPPTVEPLLRQLGLWDTFLAAGHDPAFYSLSAWGGPHLMSNEFIEQPHNRGWHLDRRRFDRMLADEGAARGIYVLTGTTVADVIRDESGMWTLHGMCEGTPDQTLHADFIVDATGRHSDIALAQGAKRVFYDRLVALIGFIDADGANERALATMIEACEYGWWYSSSVPGDQLIVACMTDNDIATRMKLRFPDQWMELLLQMPHTSARLGGHLEASSLVGPILLPANSSKLDQCIGDGWIAVGDAASTFDPLSSQGVFKGMRSGILASYAICDYFQGKTSGLERYQALVQNEFASYLKTRVEFYSEEQRWPLSHFWSRRQEMITLDPYTSLVVSNSRSLEGLEKLPLSLEPHDLKALCSLCDWPKPAHEVVASFVASTDARVSDRSTILALQQLLDHGVITIHS